MPRYSVDRVMKHKGSKHYRAILTEDDVRLILALYADGVSQAEIGRKFETSRQLIHDIVHGKSWRHVV